MIGPATAPGFDQINRLVGAYQAQQKVFAALKPYFGSAEMPSVTWADRGPDRLRHIADAEGKDSRVHPGRGGARMGSWVYDAFTNLGGGQDRQRAIDILVHELAHTQQSPRVRGAEGGVEGGADAFAKLTRMVVQRALHNPPPSRPFREYPGLSDRFLKQYGRPYALHGQFQP